MEDYRDEADAAEDLEPRSEVEAPEAPEADALEQAAVLDAATEDEGDPIGDAPEADVLEQRRAVGGDDDADEHR